MVKKMLLLLTAGLFCLAACKQEPDLPDDPHVPLVNPFIGVWNAGSEYWQFRRDGFGGKAATEAGPFSDDFSFFVYAGQDAQTAPSEGSLVIFDDTTVTRYYFDFFVNENEAALSTDANINNIKLIRISGVPQALRLTNLLLGEWSADWSNEHGSTWSVKYRDDGTVKTYHHQANHQFENAYALRGSTLVIYGAWRFGIAPIIATLSSIENGVLQLIEIQTNPSPAEWVYTKVNTAEWK